MPPDNLGYLFDAALRRRPEAAAILHGDAVLSWAELDERANRVGNGLCALGVGAGHRVALLFGNDYRFLECWLGAMRVGAVPVPLNTRMADESLAYVVGDSEAQVLIAHAALAERACVLAERVGIRRIVATDPGPAPVLDYDAWLAAASPILRRRRTRPDDICMQPYTSGSTGRPKGVPLTHGGQLWNAEMLHRAIAIDHTDRALVAVPLCHKNAMAGAIKPFLFGGGSIVVLPGFDPAEVIRAIERYGVTYMTGVPAMYRMILAETDALARHDTRSLRFAKCGSAEVPEELLLAFGRVFGALLVEGYGLTEGGPVPLANTRAGPWRTGSCGKPLPRAEVKLVADDGITEVGPHQVGELVTRNPGLARGYWNLPEETTTKFRDGWLHTGDLMRRDEDGFYYFVGRRDDLINVAGENVYPKEVEDILLRHPNVRDVCVVPAPHPTKGAVPVAFVVERQGGATGEAELKAFWLRQGAPYAHPRRIAFLDALPLGGTGKVDRSVLTQMARGLVSPAVGRRV